MTTQVSLDSVTAADFEARLNDTFRIDLRDGAIDLRLAAVRKLAQGGRSGGGFALDFVAAQGPHLPQAIYPLANAAMGALELFLVPNGPVEGGRGYEAVFM